MSVITWKIIKETHTQDGGKSLSTFEMHIMLSKLAPIKYIAKACINVAVDFTELVYVEWKTYSPYISNICWAVGRYP